jgi:UDP-N-acetylmuramoyl-tripeptide--D-alanyl-D-alanine ligase
MMHLSQLLTELNATLVGKDVTFEQVNTDSRKIQKGDLFIALRGDNFDGAAYVAASLQGGAVAAIMNRASYDSVVHGGLSALLLVDDTRIALGKLASYWRRQFAIPLVAITGSNGKTTVKEMLAAILRKAAGSEAAVLATKGNFNNDIGMPLTLLQLNAQHRYAVIEMGMNHFGEIDYLTRLALPQVALVNNASGAHLQGLGSIAGVAQAKGEIFAGLEAQGIAIINADDAHASVWRDLAGAHPIIDFALDKSAAVHGTWQAQSYGSSVQADTPQGALRLELQVPGIHNARNALAAACAALALNIPLTIIAAALAEFGGVAGRLQRKPGLCGATLIDDTYNANPASMRAALQVLAQASGKRIFVLGDMGELGADALTMHQELGLAARASGIEKMFALGVMSAVAAREFGSGAQHFTLVEELNAALLKELDAQTTVLVKGSRFMKMERVVQACAADKETTCCSH